VSAFDPLRTLATQLWLGAMTRRQTFLLFSCLYLLSFVVLMGWVLLLLVGLLNPSVMALANKVALPTLFGSVVCLEIFRRLARRAKQNLT